MSECYQHIQYGRLHVLLLAVASLQVVLAYVLRADLPASASVLACAALIVLLAFCFKKLTVSDAANGLEIRFGPIPLFGTQIAYSEITAAEVSRSTLLDGWGIHWFPGRGWTYNLWGFDCVTIHTVRRLIRVGTDDPHGLLTHLQDRMARKA